MINDITLPDRWNPINHINWNDNNVFPDGWRHNTQSKENSNNITVRRNNKYLLASQLPTIFVTNHCLFFPKFHSFTEVMETLNLTLGLHSEIWEYRKNKAHKDKIEEALELQ